MALRTFGFQAPTAAARSIRHTGGAPTARFQATASPAQGPFDEETDVLIVGSGATGLTASLRAKSLGLRSLIVERSAKIGGSSAYSAGSLWIPGTCHAEQQGITEDRATLLQYFQAAVGDAAGPESSLRRREAFLDNGPRMVRFLEDLGFRWRLAAGYPDYHPELVGGRPGGGRTIEPDVFDVRRLGDWRQHLIEPPAGVAPPVFAPEATRMMRLLSSPRDFFFTMRTLARIAWGALLGRRNVTLGYGLVAQLLFLNKQQGARIWREAPLEELLVGEDGAVVGARIGTDGGVKAVRATRGVLLCAGGFARNGQMRAEHGPAPATTEWTNVAPFDMGDAVSAGVKLGAATALLDDAWWFPTLIDPRTGKNTLVMFERARPFSIVVDSTGARFMNEAQPYNEAGRLMYQRHQVASAIPAWLIVDWNYRKRYLLGTLPFRQNGAQAIKEKRLFKADALADLAAQIGVDSAGLLRTVARFNEFCHTGKDLDFRRGESAYDRFMGDPAVGPNPNLGPIDKPPFYAVPIWPGDLGTRGGLLTDEAARVVREDGTVIQGLYAAGNTTATVMGRAYLGAGATLGPACTFAYVAVGDMAK